MDYFVPVLLIVFLGLVPFLNIILTPPPENTDVRTWFRDS